MRLLHIHSGNLYGGVETLLTTLARNRDLFPELESHFALCFEGRLTDELQLAGAAVHPLAAARISQPLTVMRARRMLKELLRHVASSLRAGGARGSLAFSLLAAQSDKRQALAGSLGRQDGS